MNWGIHQGVVLGLHRIIARNGNDKVPFYVIVIPWLRGILLIYTPKARGPQARGLRVYMSAKSQAAMVQVIYITWGALT